jgi:membrane-associated protease RseP (regulator of RpoE activity)
MKLALHVGLLVITFITTTFAGVQWLNRDPLELTNLPSGLLYASLLIMVLMSHEMGHYLAARHHNVDATLPYFIPFPSFLLFGLFPFGTLGAVIKLKESVRSRDALFDIGAAGPIAGAVVSIALLVIGFLTLPPREYLNTIHPEYATVTSLPEHGLTFGRNLLFILCSLFARDGAFVPPMNEIYHYPFLCVGWIGLFVTMMNLLPVGQLDGGHIAASTLQQKHRNMLTHATLLLLLVLGIAGFLPLLGFAFEIGWGGWLVWGVVLLWLDRQTRKHPMAFYDAPPIDRHRRIVGGLCFGLLILTFMPVPFSM